jgi:hypothetical protein
VRGMQPALLRQQLGDLGELKRKGRWRPGYFPEPLHVGIRSQSPASAQARDGGNSGNSFFGAPRHPYDLNEK